MTIAEKRKCLEAYCKTHINCTGCALHDTIGGCYEDDDLAVFNYHRVFGESEPEQKQDDGVTSPSHYKLGKYECIEEMIAIFGIKDVMTWAKLNIYKYRYRWSGKDKEKDLRKADRYMDILLDLIEKEREANEGKGVPAKN